MSDGTGYCAERTARINGRIAEVAIAAVSELDVAARSNREMARTALRSEPCVEITRFRKRQNQTRMNVDLRQIVIDAKIRAAVADRKLVIVIARSDITAARLNVLGELAVTQAGQNKAAKDRLIDHIVCCYERLENIYAAPDQ